jgi:hypothetical protein
MAAAELNFSLFSFSNFEVHRPIAYVIPKGAMTLRTTYNVFNKRLFSTAQFSYCPKVQAFLIACGLGGLHFPGFAEIEHVGDSRSL